MFTIGLPKWAMESTDPYVMRLVEGSFLEGVGHIREFFDELIAGGACQDALLIQRKQEQDRRLYKSAYDDDDEIAQRAMELYAAQAAKQRTTVPDPYLIAKSVDRWEPGPDDIVLALELKAEQDFAAELLSEDAERDDDYGQESARVDSELDAIEHLLAWAGKTELVQRAPLATVLATIKAHWDGYSEKQRKLVTFLIGETQQWETVEQRRKGDKLIDVPVKHRRISTLYERATHSETQALVEEALDRWEEQEAAHDDEAHPKTETEPAVQVALDNQARFLNWVAKGAQPAPVQEAAAFKEAKASVSAKPWLGRPTYITVLSYAMQNGARTPREAHNRAYAADTLRLADRIVGCSTEGFLVVLNKEKNQRGLVPLADARVVYPHLPAAAKARMKALSAGQTPQ